MLSVPPSTTHPPPTIPLHHIGMYRSHRYSWPLHTVIAGLIVGQGMKVVHFRVKWFCGFRVAGVHLPSY